MIKEDAQMLFKLDNEHTKMVVALVKDGHSIEASLDSSKCALLHDILGMLTELGEIADTIKRHVIYEEPLNTPNLVEEFGDLEFYFKHLRMVVCVTRAEAMQHNLDKLAKRYPGYQYTNQKAGERLDKKCQ